MIRKEILKAALAIAKAEGWQNMSMRKIGTYLKRSATSIYGHFSSREDLLAEISKFGFKKLLKIMKKAKLAQTSPLQQLVAILQAYLKFSNEETASYQVMFGVNAPYSLANYQSIASEEICRLVGDILKSIGKCAIQEKHINEQCEAFWAFAHGLAALSLTDRRSWNCSYDDIILGGIPLIISTEYNLKKVST